jgi:hypothetical protein
VANANIIGGWTPRITGFCATKWIKWPATSSTNLHRKLRASNSCNSHRLQPRSATGIAPLPPPASHGSLERKSSRSQASNRKGKARAASPNAIEILEQDHREAEEWFDEYDELERKDDDRKAELAERICLALMVHAQLEEEIFIRRLARRRRIMI